MCHQRRKWNTWNRTNTTVFGKISLKFKKIWKLHIERTLSLKENNAGIFHLKWNLERKINKKFGQNSKTVKSFKGQRK